MLATRGDDPWAHRVLLLCPGALFQAWSSSRHGLWTSARKKNMKKSQGISKGQRKEDSVTISQRDPRDSEVAQQKQKAANERSTQGRGRRCLWKTRVLPPTRCIVSSVIWILGSQQSYAIVTYPYKTILNFTLWPDLG
ncbi:unnamed protein product [Nyctereutes procyonoides]|uniref:(raccoon dog) hypothetical protein n=1 Tax=Nyctereutes procyonoides TaxID=34880 RepID=A0A811YL64_NYCPR|nr:unnamed protein product [Nyctereutes procyonoides]